MPERARVAFAIGAHPDDIEFMMGGTLILLAEAGWQTHYMTIANGSCGTATLSRDEIVAIRAEEARRGAAALGATFHRSLVDDIQIFYEPRLLAQVGAIVREVAPDILLVPSPEDYMEDHVNAGRLAVSAAFCRGMTNFRTEPQVGAIDRELTVYHALPYGLHDGLNRRVSAGLHVDVESVLDRKREALAMHASQKEWLDHSQGLDAYLNTMEEMTAEVGRMSRRFRCAEGWRRHSHLGFCRPDADPLREALGDRIAVDEGYRRALDGQDPNE